jgi:hypothetical protein
VVVDSFTQQGVVTPCSAADGNGVVLLGICLDSSLQPNGLRSEWRMGDFDLVPLLLYLYPFIFDLLSRILYDQ